MNTLSEQERRLASVLMLGVVVEVDTAAALARVEADGLVSQWAPWSERRAGAGARTWNPPRIGEQVVVACPFGDPSQAVILGSIYQDAHPAPADSAAVDRVEYADGSVVEYDQAAKRLTVNVGSGSVLVNCSTAQVVASESVTLQTPTVNATGNVNITGSLDVGGRVDAGEDVASNGVSLIGHVHQAQGSTAVTTPPLGAGGGGGGGGGGEIEM